MMARKILMISTSGRVVTHVVDTCICMWHYKAHHQGVSHPQNYPGKYPSHHRTDHQDSCWADWMPSSHPDLVTKQSMFNESM